MANSKNTLSSNLNIYTRLTKEDLEIQLKANLWLFDNCQYNLLKMRYHSWGIRKISQVQSLQERDEEI